ncbi:helix-turn-helix domain-containing protein [Ruania halotolerans]|uniref:helix-turn-helix domain-containing protein n=1 Tax=Ruania halotolerans TaxID=2897773 RepID=UPI001E3AD260|nr:helix-turn-helix domain-containing protein [Ruania halotolerans]UFU06995.1 helix-turn-helix domain-containing protein [Ruania halotolerans]
MARGDRPTRIQERAIAALLACRTLEEAAHESGVSVRTLRRWLDSEPFASLYRDQARRAAREAVSALLSGQREAVEVLRGALHTGTPATQVRAARALLELGVRAREDDVDERLDALQEEVNRWHMTTARGAIYGSIS